MPHVFKRKHDGCGDRIDQAKARAAGLTVDGITKYPDLEAEARRRLGKIVAVYGLPPREETGAGTPRSRAASDTNASEQTIEPQVASQRLSDEGDLFQELLVKVHNAFQECDIRKRQEAAGQHWYYDICGLPLRPQKPLVLGLNWGVDRSARHEPQLSEPTASALRDVRTWTFVARSEPFLRHFFAPLEDLNYLNVCPFRTPDISYLSDRDWRDSVEHFLLDAIDGISPSRVLLLGASGASRLSTLGVTETRLVSVDDNGRAVNAHVGTISGRVAKEIPFFALPHPNNKIGAAARQAIWAKSFSAAP